MRTARSAARPSARRFAMSHPAGAAGRMSAIRSTHGRPGGPPPAPAPDVQGPAHAPRTADHTDRPGRPRPHRGAAPPLLTADPVEPLPPGDARPRHLPAHPADPPRLGPPGRAGRDRTPRRRRTPDAGSPGRGGRAAGRGLWQAADSAPASCDVSRGTRSATAGRPSTVSSWPATNGSTRCSATRTCPCTARRKATPSPPGQGPATSPPSARNGRTGHGCGSVAGVRATTPLLRPRAVPMISTKSARRNEASKWPARHRSWSRTWCRGGRPCLVRTPSGCGS